MYSDLQTFKDYAATVGASSIANASDDENTAALIRGSNYIDSVYFDRFFGTPTNGLSQINQWPRKNATDIYGDAISDSVVPQCVLNAVFEAAIIEQGSSGSLSSFVSSVDQVKRKKTDVLEKEFFAPDVKAKIEDMAPKVSNIEGMLKPVIKKASSSGNEMLFAAV